MFKILLNQSKQRDLILCAKTLSSSHSPLNGKYFKKSTKGKILQCYSQHIQVIS